MHNFRKQPTADTTDNSAEKNDYPRATNGVVFGAILTFIGYFFMMMSFCSPYWIESYEETRSNFKNMGLWQYCFKDYTYPNFQFQRKFTGCHNIFSQEYYVIREWLLPGWLMSVQAFVTLSFILIFIVLVILALTIIRLPLKAVLQYEWLLIRISYLCTAVSSLFMFLAVCIFGGCAYRRDWLMYPKFNVLGWSYALAVVTFILLGLAALILHREAREAFEMRGEQRNLVMQMEMQEPGYQPPRHHHSQSRSLHVCLFVINSSTGSPSPRIINGVEAKVENTKFQVSIRLKRYETSFGNGHLCGGALVASNKILTAAHCFYNTNMKRYRKVSEFLVVMGTMNRYEAVNGTIVSQVTSIAYMKTFNMDTMRDDIGVMFLKTGLPANKTHLTVAPIALANTSTPAGVSCQVFGWGKTERGDYSQSLRTANVTTILKSVCKISYRGGIIDGMLCAGYINGGIDSCEGDSGGPLVYNNTLIGIVSFGWGCAKPGFPGVYADVHYYNKWIMERNSANKQKINLLILALTLLMSWNFYIHIKTVIYNLMKQ